VKDCSASKEEVGARVMGSSLHQGRVEGGDMRGGGSFFFGLSVECELKTRACYVCGGGIVEF
jgi:hypothetical protein